MRPLKKSVSIALDAPILERVSALAEETAPSPATSTWSCGPIWRPWTGRSHPILRPGRSTKAARPGGLSLCAQSLCLRWRRMSWPKKGRTRYSPSSREAIWGVYRSRTSSMVRLELTTVRRPAARRLFTSR